MEEKTIEGWPHLVDLVDQHKRENWLYRGVTRRDHDLVPKIGRGGARATEFKYDESHEKFLFDEFKRQVRPMLQLQPTYELEWMAVAQHHGLSTRLLDWTESLLVAAMFATESGVTVSRNVQTGEQTDIPPAIYGIQQLPEAARKANPFGLKDVQVYRPPHISPRIAPQQAAFTIHPEPQKPLDHDGLVMWVLDIKGTVDMKLALDAVGISRASLFPGVDGLADALNWRYKWGTLRV
jgi:hypothetical protein